MSIPTQTRCMEITQPGGPEVLQPTVRPLSPPGPEEVLIEVAYAGINRPDIIQRMGHYPPPPGASDILGLEVSGTVVAVGDKVSHWRPGDLVCALLSGGGYSQYVATHEGLCLPIPSGLGLDEAASLPETFFTIWFNLVEKAGLSSTDVVLIHGGSGGIGTAAIQVARAFGATVYATAGSAEKCRFCEDLGAIKAFNYKEEDFTTIKQLTDHRGADIIIDIVGGDYVGKNIRSAARKGRIISLAFLQGSKVEVDLMPVMLKELVITGSTLRSQPLELKRRIAQAVSLNLWPLIEAEQIRPLVDCILPLEEAPQAHRVMERSEHKGKILLRCR